MQLISCRSFQESYRELFVDKQHTFVKISSFQLDLKRENLDRYLEAEILD